MALSKILPASQEQYAGARNLIINGDFAVDQRNGGSSITPTNGQFSADRWKCSLSQASKFSVEQITDAPVGFQNSVKLTSLSAYTPVSGDYFLIQQQLEGYTGAHLLYGTANAKTATLSFYVKSSLTGTFGGAIRNSNGYSRTYPFEYTINSANTWERKTITFAGDTSGTYLTTNGAGITTTFSIGAGADFKSTANAWATNNDIAGSNATDVVATNSATWQLSGIQLEVGEATPFEHRSYGDELARCQRYYGKYYLHKGNEYMTHGGNISLSSNFSFPTTMRATPTSTHVQNINASNCNSSNITFVDFDGASYQVNMHVTSGTVSRRDIYAFDAEL
jgi:hypothetical protein